MRINDIENWALTILDKVKAKQPVEDTRVELKAEYPTDVKKAARRIAGHANAARGEHILWLIGVDEKTGTVPGASLTDLASWYAGVKSEFDELAPEPVSINIPVDGNTIVALYFETDRAPYVVKNPQGGSIQREVPWREATGVKSATRSQLIRLLTPIQKLPTIELVSCSITLIPFKYQNGKQELIFETYAALFLTQSTNQETVIPNHRCEISYTIPNLDTFTSDWDFAFYGVGASNINATNTFISVRGSGLFEARIKNSFDFNNADELLKNDDMFVNGLKMKLALYCVEAEQTLTLEYEFENQVSQGQNRRQWKKGWYSFLANVKR